MRRDIRSTRVKCSALKEGAILRRRQSTLSETLARFAVPNFAFIVFYFFFLRPAFCPEHGHSHRMFARQTKSRRSE